MTRVIDAALVWVVVILMYALILAAGPAAAALQCDTTDNIMTGLQMRYGEAPVRQAMAQNGAMVMWFENATSGTWTAIEVRPTGQTCILSFGTGFEVLTPPPQGIAG